jgi:hypothetical protein
MVDHYGNQGNPDIENHLRSAKPPEPPCCRHEFNQQRERDAQTVHADPQLEAVAQPDAAANCSRCTCRAASTRARMAADVSSPPIKGPLMRCW